MSKGYRICINEYGLKFLFKTYLGILGLSLFFSQSMVFLFSLFNIIVIIGFILFRDPDIHINPINQIIAPVDGMVSKITYNPEGSVVTIDSGIFDKYTKYSLVSGKVISINQNIENDLSIEIEIESITGIIKIIFFSINLFKGYTLKVEQLSINVGDYINQGEKLCFIPFMSKCEIHLSKNIVLATYQNQRVYACSSILTKMNEISIHKDKDKK